MHWKKDCRFREVAKGADFHKCEIKSYEYVWGLEFISEASSNPVPFFKWDLEYPEKMAGGAFAFTC